MVNMTSNEIKNAVDTVCSTVKDSEKVHVTVLGPSIISGVFTGKDFRALVKSNQIFDYSKEIVQFNDTYGYMKYIVGFSTIAFIGITKQ